MKKGLNTKQKQVQPKKHASKTKEAVKSRRKKPSKKDNLDLGMIETLYGMGLIDEQISKVLDISVASLNLYKKDENILESIKKGKAIADNRVVRSLYERATGYSHPEDQINVIQGQIVITPTIKHYPPDTTACIYWTKNRMREEWMDKQDVNLTGKIDLTNKTDEELDAAIQELTKQIKA